MSIENPILEAEDIVSSRVQPAQISFEDLVENIRSFRESTDIVSSYVDPNFSCIEALTHKIQELEARINANAEICKLRHS